ncbi:DUF3168 domain-containing protein [Stakelama pacifica]|uniref:Uncharacterized protein DUF3168 n=1 Tax=Stakelama pacifica TaxID=517720 RepID=A0A4R6FMC3_9SPHN|nr:DUF3168 domain-containing protein [Stakelama pacifica]TDN81785.1 uncharacterized protein DUF3168 [Stakelama pacifica]GGO96562.1 hypothetical protein GCM10011329_23380 [Stakelama pacifica]
MDLTTELRRAILISLKADSAVTALVPATSIYGQSAPATPPWPFIKAGTPIDGPQDASCQRGESIRWTLHVFAGSRKQGGAEVETVEDHIGRIMAAIKKNLHRQTLTFTDGKATLRYINSQRLIDGDASQLHGIIEFRAKVMTGWAA